MSGLTDDDRAQIIEARSHDLLSDRSATTCTEALIERLIAKALTNCSRARRCRIALAKDEPDDACDGCYAAHYGIPIT